MIITDAYGDCRWWTRILITKYVLVVDDNSAGSELQNPTSITLNVCWEDDRDEYDDGSDDYDGNDDNDGDRWSKKKEST